MLKNVKQRCKHFIYFWSMLLKFEKFQGSGNDFIMLDNRDGRYSKLSMSDICQVTNRKFGVGADGLILINSSDVADFEMDFSNPDGSKSFCGNGARCAVAFASNHGVVSTSQSFLAIDGVHDFRIDGTDVSVKMNRVEAVEHFDRETGYLNTGSPHYIIQTQDTSSENVLKLGRQIRYSGQYVSQGVNVNLAFITDNEVVHVATYERGVENETLSCGTGATACALYFADLQQMNEGFLNVETKGGKLRVSFQKTENGSFENVWLSGPAEFVFSGTFEL